MNWNKPGTLYELDAYCSMMEERHPRFSARLMKSLDIRHRRFMWQMRPNTHLQLTQADIGVPKKYRQVETSVWLR